MFNDFTIFLWLLKLGALINLYFLVNTFALSSTVVEAHILISARILFAVEMPNLNRTLTLSSISLRRLVLKVSFIFPGRRNFQYRCLYWILSLYTLKLLQVLFDACPHESQTLKDCSINTTDRPPYSHPGKETRLPIERVSLLHTGISCHFP